MEKRNVIQTERTPHLDKQAELDDFEKRAADTFKPQPAVKVAKPGKTK